MCIYCGLAVETRRKYHQQIPKKFTVAFPRPLLVCVVGSMGPPGVGFNEIIQPAPHLDHVPV